MKVRVFQIISAEKLILYSLYFKKLPVYLHPDCSRDISIKEENSFLNGKS